MWRTLGELEGMAKAADIGAPRSKTARAIRSASHEAYMPLAAHMRAEEKARMEALAKKAKRGRKANGPCSGCGYILPRGVTRHLNPATRTSCRGGSVYSRAMNPGECKRCRGSQVVRLGKNLVKCPLCQRKANPLNKHEVAREIREVKKARLRSEEAQGQSETDFQRGYAHGVAGAVLREGPRGYETKQRVTHGVMLALGDKPSFHGSRKARGTTLHGKTGSMLGPRKRNPLDSHKPGCQCMYHSGRMGKKK